MHRAPGPNMNYQLRFPRKIFLADHWFLDNHIFHDSFCLFQNNIGHKLLLKQGWQEGQGLGKQLQGRTFMTFFPLKINAPFSKAVCP